MAETAKRRWNWATWAGSLVVLVAFLSYFMFFARFPITRDFPWLNLLLFVPGGYLILEGLKKSFREPEVYRGRLGGSILALVAFLIFDLFIFYSFILSAKLPASHEAPQIGQKAPDFTLSDQNRQPVTLSKLLAGDSGAKPGAVLLIFYRGYW